MARQSFTKTAWAKRSLHTIGLPSGQQVKVKIPNLAQVLRDDALPNRLKAAAAQQLMASIDPVATGEAMRSASDEERIAMVTDAQDLYLHVAAGMLVEPEGVTTEDFTDGSLPYEDAELLIAIAQRERDTDARGVRLGVEPLSRWEAFRREHGCSEDCPACEALRRAFSSVDMDEL